MEGRYHLPTQCQGWRSGSFLRHPCRQAGRNPSPVLTRARQVLAQLEQGGSSAKASKTLSNDLPLFEMAMHDQTQTDLPTISPETLNKLRDLSPDELSPREALEALYDLKAHAG